MRQFVVSLSLTVEADTFKGAAAVFDGLIRDPGSSWAFTVKERIVGGDGIERNGETRMVDMDDVDLEKDYPDF